MSWASGVLWGHNDDRKVLDDIHTLKLDNVSFAYPARPDVQVLQSVNLTIHKAQIRQMGSFVACLPFGERSACRDRRWPLWGNLAVEKALSWLCWNASMTHWGARFWWMIWISGHQTSHSNLFAKHMKNNRTFAHISAEKLQFLSFRRWQPCPCRILYAMLPKPMVQRKWCSFLQSLSSGGVGLLGFLIIECSAAPARSFTHSHYHATLLQ